MQTPLTGVATAPVKPAELPKDDYKGRLQAILDKDYRIIPLGVLQQLEQIIADMREKAEADAREQRAAEQQPDNASKS